MIKVVVTTYAPEGSGSQRAGYTARTVDALIENLISTEPLSLHIADDGSLDDIYIKRAMIKASKAWKTPSSMTNAARHGIGASLNKAMKAVDDLWIYMTDDWVLTEKLYLAPAIKLINLGYDVVRLGPIHPNLTCKTKFNVEIGWWLEIDTCCGFAFATRPFLATKDFYKKVGQFDENLNAYDTERLYAEKVANRRIIRIAYDGSQSLMGNWLHIGEFEVGTIDFGSVAHRA